MQEEELSVGLSRERSSRTRVSSSFLGTGLIDGTVISRPTVRRKFLAKIKFMRILALDYLVGFCPKKVEAV